MAQWEAGFALHLTWVSSRLPRPWPSPVTSCLADGRKGVFLICSLACLSGTPTASCSVPQNQNSAASSCPHLCLGQDPQGAEGPTGYPGPPSPRPALAGGHSPFLPGASCRAKLRSWGPWLRAGWTRPAHLGPTRSLRPESWGCPDLWLRGGWKVKPLPRGLFGSATLTLTWAPGVARVRLVGRLEGPQVWIPCSARLTCVLAAPRVPEPQEPPVVLEPAVPK